MKRPFYVYTPRNCHGEDLVRLYNDGSLQYEVRSTLTGETVYFTSKNYGEARDRAKKLDDESEARWNWDRTPDKPCQNCGHDNLHALKVTGKTQSGEKTVLCLNCEAALNKKPIILAAAPNIKENREPFHCLSEEFFKDAKILNLAEVVGKPI